MVTLLMVLFVILCLFLALFILIQQGKGDMGLGSLGGGGQMLFGGSGGQEFFEKLTWIMGALFILGALGLTILKTKQMETSRLKEYKSLAQTTQPANTLPSLPTQENKKL